MAFAEVGLENPWTAAQRFLQANELPLSYLDEVVRFIEKNTAGVSLGGGGTQYSDPYTGTNQFTNVLWGVPDVLHFLKEDPDTSQQVVPCQTRLPGEIPSLERLGTNRRLHQLVPPKADTPTRSRGITDINLPLLPDSRLNRPILLHRPPARVVSYPM